MEEYWNRIKCKYPNAFNELCKDHNTIEEWGEIDSPHIWGILIDEPRWVLRHLLDFFDSRGIHICIHTSNGIFWTQTIRLNHVFQNIYYMKHKTRLTAELKAYEKAFGILENKIKSGKNK